MNVAKSNLYSIDVDSRVNRLYISLSGVWNTIGDVPNLQEDLKEAVSYLQEGCTCCTDMSQLQGASADCHVVLSSSKMVLLQKGITKDAFVVNGGIPLMINFNSGSAKMVGKSFPHLSDAENWLNTN